MAPWASYHLKRPAQRSPHGALPACESGEPLSERRFVALTTTAIFLAARLATCRSFPVSLFTENTLNAMSLKKYQAKRKFDQTPEPEGQEVRSQGPLRFVVQLHRASHL